MKQLLLIAILALVSCGDSKSTKKGDPSTCDDCSPTAGSTELSVEEPSDSLREGGPSATTVLRLVRQPASDVTVLMVSLKPNMLTVEPTEVTFAPATWNTAQLVTLTPGDNRTDEPDHEVSIEFTLVSDDPGFGGRPVNPLVVTVADNDEAGSFNVSAEEFVVPEDGTPVEVEITLGTQPGGDVLVPLRLDDESQAELDTERLTFTELDWNLPQTVTITGIDDLTADGDQTFNLVLGPTNSTEETFNGLPEQFVEFTSKDGVCGNGVTDGEEQCEPDGSGPPTCEYGDEDCTYCTDSCTIEAGTGGGYCGDGQVQNAHEDCDEPATTCPYGEASCLVCRQCQEVSEAGQGYCGDGIVQQAHEQCDGSFCCNDSCQVDNSNCDVGCLIISEYVEGTQVDKAVELYNCDNKTIPLDGLTLCAIGNENTNCTDYHELSGSLSAGATRTICNSGVTFPSFCDTLETYVTRFNGDDRLVLFMDTNGDHTIQPTETIVDAFGQTAVQPNNFPPLWSDKVYTRCNFDAYDGKSLWNVTDYFEDTGACDSFCQDVYQGLGVPPVETCP